MRCNPAPQSRVGSGPPSTTLRTHRHTRAHAYSHIDTQVSTIPFKLVRNMCLCLRVCVCVCACCVPAWYEPCTKSRGGRVLGTCVAHRAAHWSTRAFGNNARAGCAATGSDCACCPAEDGHCAHVLRAVYLAACQEQLQAPSILGYVTELLHLSAIAAGQRGRQAGRGAQGEREGVHTGFTPLSYARALSRCLRLLSVKRWHWRSVGVCWARGLASGRAS